MKKILIALSVISIMTFFISCSNKNDDNEFVEVLFEGNGLTKTTSNKFNSDKTIPVYNSPIRIERIKKKDSLVINQIEKIEKIKGIQINELDFNQIRQYTYLNTKTKVLAIPKVNKIDQDELVIYLNNEKTIYANAILQNIENGERLFKLCSLENGKIFYSVIIRSDDKIKSLKVNKVILPNLSSKTTLDKFGKMQSANSETCPQSTSNFNDCMVCAISQECAGDWVCAATCMVAPVPCLIGFGIACAF